MTRSVPMTDAADTIPNRGYHAHIYYDPARTRSIRRAAVCRHRREVQGRVWRVPRRTGRTASGRRGADAAPRRPRRADPPADGRLGRRPQHLRDVARLAGAAEARGVAAQLSRRAATERLSDRLPAGVPGEGGGGGAPHSPLLWPPTEDPSEAG